MNPTPHRTIRVPDSLWGPFRDKAQAEGSDASAMIRQLIAAYLAGQGPRAENPR